MEELGLRYENKLHFPAHLVLKELRFCFGGTNDWYHYFKQSNVSMNIPDNTQTKFHIQQG